MKRALECSFLLYLENKYIIRKVPLFKLFFNDSGDTVHLEQTQACHIFESTEAFEKHSQSDSHKSAVERQITLASKSYGKISKMTSKSIRKRTGKCY